jgi:hypothetical protein
LDGEATKPAAAPPRSDCRAYLAIAVAGLLFFAPLVLHPGRVLYSDHSDFLALHLPLSHFQIQSWRETGELPMWCPYVFGGLPLSHNLYPFDVPFFVLPESWLAPGSSWVMVGHVLVAGWGMFVYSRARGLRTPAALVAAFASMFGGSWLLHLLLGGHYFIGLAWLPWLLRYLERALRQGRVTSATAAGVFYGLLVWGTHPQIAVYAGLFIALWTLEVALEEAGYLGGAVEPSASRTARTLGRWLAFGAWTACVGAALAAVHLLPAGSFARTSTRAGGIGAGELFALGRQTLCNLVGPSLERVPTANSAWEERGGLGLIVLALAVLAPVLRRDRRVYAQTMVCGILFLFGLGGALAFQWLPVVAMLREPARMFLIAGFPVAFLAGISVDALLGEPAPTQETRGVSRFVLVALTVVVGALTGVWAKMLVESGHELAWHPYWIALAFTLPMALWLLGGSLPYSGCVWIALVLIDVCTLSRPHLHTRAEQNIYPVSKSVRFLMEHRGDHGRVLDEDFDPFGRDLCSPLGRGAPMAIREELYAVRGYHPLDIYRYKKFLQFLGDVDLPLVPLEDALTFPILRDVVLDSQIDMAAMEASTIGLIPTPQAPGPLLAASAIVPGRYRTNQGLLNLLGVRWLLCPAERIPPPGWPLVMTDPAPPAFDVSGPGVCTLGEYVIYENPHALPRAFVVPDRAPLVEPILETLKSTDFRRTVLVAAGTSDHHDGPPRTATIIRYQPNEVRIQVDAGTPGYLVLTDPWFENWMCKVDGKGTDVMQADYAFRAVAVPGESCEAVFRFDPPAFRWGWRITGFSTVLVLFLLAIGSIRRLLRP